VSLGLNVQDDPATRLVKIMALAKRDIYDVETLRDLTLREFGKETSAEGCSPLGVKSWATETKGFRAPSSLRQAHHWYAREQAEALDGSLPVK